MKYTHFEELPVWQTAMELAVGIYAIADDKAFANKGDLRSQLLSAAVSISNNIAEGFERGTTNELLAFLYIARGSAGETRSMLHLCDRLPAFNHLKSQISNLRSLAESCSRQLQKWAESLQNSDITGPRYLNDKVRAVAEQKKRADAFAAQLKEAQRENTEKWMAELRAQKSARDDTQRGRQAATK